MAVSRIGLLTEDHNQEFYDMIKGIARKASKKLYNRDVDDIEQDLWVKVLETEERKGKELDAGLAAKICWDYVTDMQRQDIRRQNHVAMSYDPEILDDLLDDEQSSAGASSRRDNGDYDSDLAVQELFDKFPIGSKERMYLDFWGNASGVMPNDRAVPDPTATGQNRYNDKALAKMLGTTQSNRSYRKFKQKMQDIVMDYLGN